MIGHNIKNNTFLLLSILFLCLFQDVITSFIPLFKYFDEILALIVVPIFIFNISKIIICNKKKLIINKINGTIFLFLGIYLIIGTISFIRNSNQPILALYGDLFLNCKFFFALYIGNIIGKSKTEFKKREITKFIITITIFFFILILINFFIPIFPTQGVRFGISLQKLFFSHSGNLASATILLFVMTLYVYENLKRPFFYILMQLFIILTTLRYKAIACAIIFLLIYFVKFIFKSKFKIYHFLIFVSIFIPISWNQILLYYGSKSMNTARGALTITSFKIANDLFPLGAGFGTYACYMTKLYYSSYYYKYELNDIQGLTPDSKYFSFFSDTFWPMVIGQTGYLGLVSYILIWYLILKEINKIKIMNTTTYLSCICVLIYLFIESTSSAAFVSPQAIPFAIWIAAIKTNTYINKKIYMIK